MECTESDGVEQFCRHIAVPHIVGHGRRDSTTMSCRPKIGGQWGLICNLEARNRYNVML